MDADGIDLEDDNVEQEEDVDTDNIQSDVVDGPNDDERLDSGFVDEVLVGDNSSYDYYGDSDLETIEEPVRRRHVKSVGKKKNGSDDEDESDTEDKRKFYWEVMEKTFVSEAAAYTFYNGYARQEGFSVRKFKFKETKDYGMTLVDLILHYENAIVRIRETEAKDDCISSQTSPVPVTNLRRIERAAAKLLVEVRLRNESVEMMEKDP
ncbi:uncharacterized protein LOC124689878 [Lolium rigidum]|uniref:uncharacterized protein LOC124689878 n=1 Tax=Lolium rigidum TaxID=89674 RepID=UPI001F5C2AEB|nr:uncharacterized protein LOC124689878 [Lolium rigidum]